MSDQMSVDVLIRSVNELATELAAYRSLYVVLRDAYLSPDAAKNVCTLPSAVTRRQVLEIATDRVTYTVPIDGVFDRTISGGDLQAAVNGVGQMIIKTVNQLYTVVSSLQQTCERAARAAGSS